MIGHSERHSRTVGKQFGAAACALALGLCAAALLAPPAAQARQPAAKAGNAPQKDGVGKGKAKAGSARKGVKVANQQNNSEEPAAARDRRLARECRGLPNAGACLGYARR